jgi:GntR family transcriptional regulator
MTQIRLDHRSSEPLYHQIANQVRQLIAVDELKPGDHLPTVRNLAQYLHLNYNTVVRAYLELEKENIVIARRGGGTVVAANAGDPSVRQIQQRHLSDIVSDNILRVLSLGYSPEEVEAAFYLHLARWREERKASTGIPAVITDSSERINTIRIVGSHDLALSMLLSLIKQRDDSLEFEITHA